jgi:uncharacterized protein
VIVYLDTSALLPLLIEEPGSELAAQLWDEADRVVAVRLLYVEARAALAQAHRLGRVADEQLADLIEGLEQLYAQIDVVEIDDALVRRAGQLAQEHGLRGYDATHLAAAERIDDTDMVLASGDEALTAAALRLGLATSNTSAGDPPPPDPGPQRSD